MSDVPKKNSKMLIIVLVAVALVIVAIAGVFALGGACCLGSFFFSAADPSPAGPEVDAVTLFDEPVTIAAGDYAYYEVAAEPGQLVEARVTTGGEPLDVMVMDTEQFADYEDAVMGLNDGAWRSIDTVTGVVSESVSCTADAYDIYYIVIDNTENPASGSEAGKDVSVNLVITLTSVV